MKYLVIVCGLLIVGCAGDPQTRATAALAVSCDSIGTAFLKLAEYRKEGKLSSGQISTVRGIRTATAPFCDPNSKVDPAKVVTFVQEAEKQITAILGD